MNVLILEGLLQMLRKRLERLKICLEILEKYIILKGKGKMQILRFSEFIYLEEKIGISSGGENQCFSDSAKGAVKRRPTFPHVHKNSIVNFKVEMKVIVYS